MWRIIAKNKHKKVCKTEQYYKVQTSDWIAGPVRTTVFNPENKY